MMIAKPKQPTPLSTQSGFTLIECLLAIIIVSILLVAVAPALVFATATRVQARRVELATQAARTYVDGVKAGTIPPPPNRVFLTANKTNIENKNLFTSTGLAVPLPSGSSGWICTPTNLPINQGVDGLDMQTFKNSTREYCVDAGNKVFMYCVDMDGDKTCTTKSQKDFFIHAFRSVAPSTANPAIQDESDYLTGSKGYIMGVRVYRADAFADSVPVKPTPLDGQGRAKRQLAATSGVGDKKTPVVEYTTEVRPTGADYNSLKQRLGTQTP